MNILTIIPSVETLKNEWLALGYQPGAPSHMHADMVQADLRIYRGLKCAACGHRGHKVQPYHRRQEYRLLCTCRQCGNQTEA
jgi:hypothetical protein